MVFHCSLIDSKSPQVSRTFLSILDDLNNAVVSTRPLISKPSCPCTDPSVTYRAYQLQLASLPLSCSIVFSVLQQGLGNYLSFHFLSVLPTSRTKQQSSLCALSQESEEQQVLEVPVVKWLSSQDMDTATRVQILDETDCISHCTNTLGKGMNPIILPPPMGK